MSLCKHNIIAGSTFSRCAAAINQNPDRKIFYPWRSDSQGVQKYLRALETKEISPLDNRFIQVPFDFYNQPEIDMRPWFSLLMVVNNDIATLEDTLESILSQDYKYHEVIIIDNASYDDSGQLCRQAAKISDKVTLIKLYDKISDGAARNKALNIAQGNFVMFLKGNDKIFPDALTSLFLKISPIDNVACALSWFREDEQGTIEIADKKFSVETDSTLSDLEESEDKAAVISEILSGNKVIAPLATKIFRRQFLTDNALCFDEQAADAELKFMTEAILRTDEEMLFVPNPFYVAPRK